MSKPLVKKPREYPPEFKIQAVKLLKDQGITLTQAAKDLGIPLGTLHHWVVKFERGEWSLPDNNVQTLKVATTATPKTFSQQKLHEQLSVEQRKNAELERQLRRMTMERDILKKAMAYCIEIPK